MSIYSNNKLVVVKSSFFRDLRVHVIMTCVFVSMLALLLKSWVRQRGRGSVLNEVSECFVPWLSCWGIAFFCSILLLFSTSVTFSLQFCGPPVCLVGDLLVKKELLTSIRSNLSLAKCRNTSPPSRLTAMECLGTSRSQMSDMRMASRFERA